MLFSVVVTCYNQRAFISDAIKSVLNQFAPDVEVIVIDDGSTDGSAELIASYGEAIRSALLGVNRGAIHARNFGASMARGEYLVFLDGDDLLLPWGLDVYTQIVQERRPVVLLARSIWFKGARPAISEPRGYETIDFVEYPALLEKDRPAGLSASTYVVEKNAFWSVGGWSAELFHLDLQDLSTKLGFSGRAVLICSPATALYRIHSGNSIHSVSPFVRSALRLLEKERTGQYPGGDKKKFLRRAWLGGMLIFWVRRAVRAGLYFDALRLIVSGWTMMLASVVRRARIVWRRKPVQGISQRTEVSSYRGKEGVGAG